ncbi:HAD hydrolase-like protein [Streptomyces sp. NBC_01795]|uniref:HAD hydrolase-like protein n=1 Tax=unclassified Streptomyces TaxID=2593676 RepID=UPI002DD7AEA8|nr:MULTISPECIES: HAD hydrolase-like protein [unclassified Streptomyces]WSA95721.1 HAD hydrolase-like protein [Streptomyces sp. NBC_01795]WSB80140.1 HAD hydrolase-like protein [Streptomyces sp. NBC_01775]
MHHNSLDDGGKDRYGRDAASVRYVPQAAERPPHAAYDTALLDLDGVVYAGGEALPHAVDSLGAARESGLRLAYVTNNAARTPDTVAAHLSELGVPALPDEVITSAQAVARLIAGQVPEGAPVLAIGAEGLTAALEERGLRVVASADEDPAAVVQGYGGPHMAWERLMEGALAVQRGVPWFASNTDLTIPSNRGIAPGNGAAVEVVRIATRWMRKPPEPVVAGKPLPPMHRESILRTGAQRPLVVGDRLDTDIEGAHAGRVDSLLVLTGVTDGAQLLAAPPVHRPTYVARDLRGLLEVHPEVTGDASAGFRCGGWEAVAGLDALELSGDGDPLDGLRALCGAAWRAGGEDGCALDTEKALARLGL